MNATTRTVEPEIKRTQILGAARELLIRQGLQDLTMDRIAEEAGVSKGTLFLYFQSKEDLFSSVFEELVDQLGESLISLMNSKNEGEALITEMVETILNHFDRNHDFMTNFSNGRFPSCGQVATQKLLAKFSENIDTVRAILRRTARTGIVDSKKTELGAVALIGLCRSVAFMKHKSGSKTPLVNETSIIVDLFLNGMGNHS